MNASARRLLYGLPYTIVAVLTLFLLFYEFVNYDKMRLGEHVLSLCVAICGCFISVAGFTKLRDWIREGRL